MQENAGVSSGTEPSRDGRGCAVLGVNPHDRGAEASRMGQERN